MMYGVNAYWQRGQRPHFGSLATLCRAAGGTCCSGSSACTASTGSAPGAASTSSMGSWQACMRGTTGGLAVSGLQVCVLCKEVAVPCTRGCSGVVAGCCRLLWYMRLPAPPLESLAPRAISLVCLLNDLALSWFLALPQEKQKQIAVLLFECLQGMLLGARKNKAQKWHATRSVPAPTPAGTAAPPRGRVAHGFQRPAAETVAKPALQIGRVPHRLRSPSLTQTLRQNIPEKRHTQTLA